ncbi:hypothetical protein Efla_004611 [Eimeria flavescens]
MVNQHYLKLLKHYKSRKPFLCRRASPLPLSLLLQQQRAVTTVRAAAAPAAGGSFSSKLFNCCPDPEAASAARRYYKPANTLPSPAGRSSSSSSSSSRSSSQAKMERPEAPSAEQQQQEKQLKDALKEAGVSFKEHSHALALTVEEATAALQHLKIPGTKNLFLKDKKGSLFLLTTLPDSPTPLKGLMAKLHVQKLRLADEGLLYEKLRVRTGAVSPFALLYDQKKEVTFLLDSKLAEGDRPVLLHPMHSFQSLEVSTKQVFAFLKDKGITINPIDCEELQKLAEAPEAAADKMNGASAGKGAHAAAKTGKEEQQQQHETTLGVTVKKASNFAEWYTQAITRGELIEYYDVSGCYVIRPWAFKMWEIVQKAFDDGIKELGVENCYFPMFVSKARLEKEKDHVEGFKAEVAWVTQYGDSELPEKVAIRPTSETVMYPAYAKWIRSHRDLPLLLNQWNNVVRQATAYGFKQPTPFLRTREFLWQEGHTAHATEEEAYALVLKILELYRQGIQAATSHLLGQNFSRMFGIEFEDEKGEKQFVHQTSWGCTTRSLGVAIMVHGDDKGLVLPPRVVNIQAVIIPIIFKETGGTEILEKCRELEKTLKKVGIRVKVDDRSNYTPGWKFNDWELKGVPLRLEVGPKDVEKQQTRVVRRDTCEAQCVGWGEVGSTIPALLETIHRDLFNKAKAKLDASIEQITDFKDVMPALNRRHLVLAPWCEDPDTETEIKKETQRLSEMQAREQQDGMTGAMKTLCLPFDQPPLPAGTKCFFTGRPATRWCLFGRSY